jgi:1,4-dihydroxy-2-naphthoyl-CoA hydrolase
VALGPPTGASYTLVMVDVARLNDGMKSFFPGLLGIRFLEAEKERVRASLLVRDDLCTTPGVLHGGAVMAFADTLGAVGSVLNLPPGAGTTTIESKTNFLSAGKGGTTIEGDCTPLHRGRRTMVWQTRILAPDGKVIALVTQTQAVLEAKPQPFEILAGLFAGKSDADQKTLLETLERSGAALYRRWAEAEPDPAARAELLRGAEREDQNAETLRKLLGR